MSGGVSVIDYSRLTLTTYLSIPSLKTQIIAGIVVDRWVIEIDDWTGEFFVAVRFRLWANNILLKSLDFVFYLCYRSFQPTLSKGFRNVLGYGNRSGRNTLTGYR